MKIKLGSKKLQQLKKTHNFYLYKTGTKVYYKAIPKRNVKVIRERRSYLWPALAVLAIICAIVAKGMGNKPETYAEVKSEPEAMEVVAEEEITESITENKGEEVKEEAYTGVCAEWYDLVAQYDWDIKIALAVMKAESGCNPNAVNYNTNGTRDTGLFQLNSQYWLQTFEPAENVKEAYRVYTRSGNKWTPWVVYNTGKYLQYL